MLETEPTYVKSKEGDFQETIDPNPYMWMSENKKSIYFQDGEFYTGSGEPPIKYEDVPQFFWRMARENYTEEGRAKFNLILPEDRVKTREEKAEASVKKLEELWKCNYPECDAEVSMRAKGTHMMMHGREEKAARKKAKEKAKNAKVND